MDGITAEICEQKNKEGMCLIFSGGSADFVEDKDRKCGDDDESNRLLE